MKKTITLLVVLLLNLPVKAQVSGNANYQSQIKYYDNNINISYPSSADMFVNVKGIANIKADAYVAIFNVSQVGKTTEEVNTLMDVRINQSLSQFKNKAGIETYVDMISFVPVYEFQAEKKLFSKTTYNEIPTGFELKKNIHIKYRNPNDLNGIITALTNSEIYDLVRVDYFSDSLESVKKLLMAKAKTIVQEKLKIYQTLLGGKLDSVEKQLTDGYKVMLPVEQYKTYQAYNSSSLDLKKGVDVNKAEKSTTLYYQPIIDKEFDFVINPAILEPVIQVMYEITIKVNREKEPVKKADKEYIFITPTGELKNLNINK